jgi:serine/threonine protein kinase
VSLAAQRPARTSMSSLSPMPCAHFSSPLSRFVHRDLATRNVLVADGVPKIADFGLACPLADDKEYYKSSGGRIPLRWCAPECINFKKYSSASDVWAFAVVMWEVFACGEIPFSGVPNVILAKEVCDGLRLGPPNGTPLRVYNLWLQMWEPEVSSRAAMPIVRAELQSALDEDDLEPIVVS